jgi:hypothetical protein
LYEYKPEDQKATKRIQIKQVLRCTSKHFFNTRTKQNENPRGSCSPWPSEETNPTSRMKNTTNRPTNLLLLQQLKTKMHEVGEEGNRGGERSKSRRAHTAALESI